MSAVLGILREELRVFAGYSSARNEASGGSILLNANESPWTASGDALGLNRYPDPQPAALVERLAALYGVSTDEVLVGRGSDEAIDLLTRAACRAGRDAVLISPPTFGMYAVCARIQDAVVVSVPLRAELDFSVDVDAVVAAISDASRPIKLVYVCSPNNPTGATVSLTDIERLARATEGRALLVVDEAYAEFSDQVSALSLRQRYPHVVVLRTLSKAYALAGARIGVAIGQAELMAVLRSIMAPYPLPTPCLVAAMSALSDSATALVRSRIALLRSERARLARALTALPQVDHVYDSDANFLLVRFSDRRAAYQHALAGGVVLRDPSKQVGLENCLRITIGTPEENNRVLRVVADAPVQSIEGKEAAA